MRINPYIIEHRDEKGHLDGIELVGIARSIADIYPRWNAYNKYNRIDFEIATEKKLAEMCKLYAKEIQAGWFAFDLY